MPVLTSQPCTSEALLERAATGWEAGNCFSWRLLRLLQFNYQPAEPGSHLLKPEIGSVQANWPSYGSVLSVKFLVVPSLSHVRFFATLQQARLPWSSLSSGACSNSCPMSRYFRDEESIEFSMVSAKVLHTFPGMRGTDQANVYLCTTHVSKI